MGDSPEILFEDTHLIVLSKPAGLLSQGEISGEPNLVDWARGHFGRNYVGLVHRLDRNTSGIMVLAKRSKSANRLTESLQAGKIYRSYLGWVEGNVEGPVEWRHFLKKDESTNVVRVVRDRSQGQESALSARPLAHAEWRGQPLTLLEYVLETGRSHQIRVQSAHERHALLGDPKYGRGAASGFSRPALHSWVLRFPHPMTSEVLEFKAALPKDMRSIGNLAGL